MLPKFLKKLKLPTNRKSNGDVTAVQAFLQEIKAGITQDSSWFTEEDKKHLEINLLIMGEGKGATNKWLFYNSSSDVTTNEDVKAIAELCFGNFRLESESDASKVHLYKPKGRLSHPHDTGILLSRVSKFSPGEPRIIRRRNDTSQSSENEDAERGAQAVPCGSPSRGDNANSGSSRSSAYFSSTESIFSQSPGRSHGSLPRETCPWLVNSVGRKSRVDISMRSSIDLFRWSQFMEVLDPESARGSTGDIDHQQTGEQSSSSKKRRRRHCDLGFAVLFQTSGAHLARRFRAFFFANFGCIESRMLAMCEALARVVEGNTAQRCATLCATSFSKFKDEITDLLFAPRLVRPLWLAMSDGCSDSTQFYDVFLHRCLMVALDNYNPKQFVSTVITAVLCNHLAWISTVEPVGSLSSGHSHMLSKQSPDWPEYTSYNPHCAQINDLYGLLGFPLRLARTLVVGKDPELVEFFLFLISYFLRCSNVTRRFEELPSAGQALSSSLPTQADAETQAKPPSTSAKLQPQDQAAITGSEKKQDTPCVHKASVDSGVSSSEDVRAFMRAFPALNTADVTAEPPALRYPSECEPTAFAAVPNDVDTGARLCYRVRQFATITAQYSEIPLLYGDVRPLRSNGQRCLEASLVSSDSEAEEDGAEIFEWDNSGHSLLAGVHSHSASFFALQGTVDPNWADNLPGQLADMLVSGVGEQAEEAACIVVDTDRFCVQEYRLKAGEDQPRRCCPVAAKCVISMLSQVVNLAKVSLSSDICLRFLEDRLQGIYINALVAAEIADQSSVTKTMGYDKSDLSLLEAIAGVGRPMLAS